METSPSSVSEISSKFRTQFLVRRWLGAWVDFVVTVACLLVPDSLLGNALYQQTIAVWLGLALGHFIVGEWLWGRTLGKLVTRLVVVDESGKRPSLTQIVIRAVFRLFEVNPFVAGGLPAGIAVLATRNGQRLGDKVAGTYVVGVLQLSQLGRGAAGETVDTVHQL